MAPMSLMTPLMEWSSNHAMPFRSALRSDQSLTPTSLPKGDFALLSSAVELHELGKGHPWLKLVVVEAGHDHCWILFIVLAGCRYSDQVVA